VEHGLAIPRHEVLLCDILVQGLWCVATPRFGRPAGACWIGGSLVGVASCRECCCRLDTIGERSLRPRQIGHVRAGALGTPAPASCHPVMSEATGALHGDSPAPSCTTDIWNRVAGPIPGAVRLVHRRGDLRRALVGPWRAGLDIPALTYDTMRCPRTS
jgi:hypothetical protein